MQAIRYSTRTDLSDGFAPLDVALLRPAISHAIRQAQAGAWREAADYVGDHYWDSTGQLGKAHGDSIAKEFLARAEQVEKEAGK